MSTASHLDQMERLSRRFDRAYRKVNGLPYRPEHRADVPVVTTLTLYSGSHRRTAATSAEAHLRWLDAVTANRLRAEASA